MSISIRPFQPNDLQGVLRVLAQSMHADAIPESRFVRQVLLDANFRPKARRGGARRRRDRLLPVDRAASPLENAPSDAEKGT
jgi:hypothetical protein